jgi:hypothetical protein
VQEDNWILPTDLIVAGIGVDGGGGPGFVEVSKGCLMYGDDVACFCISHEMTHAVEDQVLNRFQLVFPDLRAGSTMGAKRREYLADLAALHTLTQRLPSMARQLKNSFRALKLLLGKGDTYHPSGEKRIEKMEEYYQSVTEGGMLGLPVLGRLLRGVLARHATSGYLQQNYTSPW